MNQHRQRGMDSTHRREPAYSSDRTYYKPEPAKPVRMLRKDESPFVIVCSYGSNRNMLYAGGSEHSRIETYKDATRMLGTARRFGYQDAEIWNEKDFRSLQEAREAERSSKATAARADREARGVHDLRPRPTASVARKAG